MFNKISKPSAPNGGQNPPAPIEPLTQQQQRRPATAAARIASMLASDLVFEGNIIGNGDLHIDGTIRGDVKAGRLTIGESGNIEGGVDAEIVEVRGRVVGTIKGKQVKLLGTAYVEGDISHEQLSIDVGAYFQGSCTQSRKVEPARPVAPAPAAAAQPIGFTAPVVPPAGGAEPAKKEPVVELKPAAV
jgi:cytoskeletal protein CcmA (bactofilin family)